MRVDSVQEAARFFAFNFAKRKFEPGRHTAFSSAVTKAREFHEAVRALRSMDIVGAADQWPGQVMVAFDDMVSTFALLRHEVDSFLEHAGRPAGLPQAPREELVCGDPAITLLAEELLGRLMAEHPAAEAPRQLAGVLAEALADFEFDPDSYRLRRARPATPGGDA